MRYLRSVGTYFLDFIFPKTDSLIYIESLSPSELYVLLPPPREIEDKNLIVLFDYTDDRVREMIWELKYKGNRNMGRIFAEMLMDVLQTELSEYGSFENFIHPILIPMPMSRARRRERGWSQTEIVTKEIIKLDTENIFEYMPDVLIKHRHTESQARLRASREERVESLADSMSVPSPEKLSGRCVVLLDDVTTSGATFSEAVRTLKSAGVKKVLKVALSH